MVLGLILASPSKSALDKKPTSHPIQETGGSPPGWHLRSPQSQLTPPTSQDTPPTHPAHCPTTDSVTWCRPVLCWQCHSAARAGTFV